MRTDWSDKIPPQDFLADGVDILQYGKKSLSSNVGSLPLPTRVEFCLGPRLNICVYRHSKEERVCR